MLAPLIAVFEACFGKGPAKKNGMTSHSMDGWIFSPRAKKKMCHIHGFMDFLATRKKKSVPHYFDIMHVISSRHRPEALPGVLPPPPPVLLPPPLPVPPPLLVQPAIGTMSRAPHGKR